MFPDLQSLIKYLLEGAAVAVAAFYIPRRKVDLQEIALIALTAAAVFAVLDMFAPSIAAGSRQGAGFGIGYQMTGGDSECEDSSEDSESSEDENENEPQAANETESSEDDSSDDSDDSDDGNDNGNGEGENVAASESLTPEQNGGFISMPAPLN